MQPGPKETIEAFLIDAISKSARYLRIKNVDQFDYDIGLEDDFNNLLDAFIGHLELMAAISKGDEK